MTTHSQAIARKLEEKAQRVSEQRSRGIRADFSNREKKLAEKYGYEEYIPEKQEPRRIQLEYGAEDTKLINKNPSERSKKLQLTLAGSYHSYSEKPRAEILYRKEKAHPSAREEPVFRTATPTSNINQMYTPVSSSAGGTVGYEYGNQSFAATSREGREYQAREAAGALSFGPTIPKPQPVFRTATPTSDRRQAQNVVRNEQGQIVGYEYQEQSFGAQTSEGKRYEELQKSGALYPQKVTEAQVPTKKAGLQARSNALVGAVILKAWQGEEYLGSIIPGKEKVQSVASSSKEKSLGSVTGFLSMFEKTEDVTKQSEQSVQENQGENFGNNIKPIHNEGKSLLLNKDFYLSAGKSIGYGVEYGLTEIASSFYDRPVQSAVGFYAGAKAFQLAPKVATVGFTTLAGYDVLSQPTLPRKITEGIGQAAILGAFIGGAKAIEKQPFKIRTLEIPTEEGIKKTTLFGLETPKGRAVVLVSKGEEGLGIGRPNVVSLFERIPSGKDVKIGSGLETATVKKSLELMSADRFVNAERAQNAIPLGRSILRKTTKTKSSFTSELPKETERLPEEGVRIVLDVAKKNEGIVFGSFSRGGQLAREYKIKGEQYELSKVPRDIDVRFDLLGEEQTLAIAKDTLKRFQNAGIKSRLIEEGGVIKPSIEADIGKGFEKAVEFKSKESNILEGEEGVPEYVLGLKKVGKPIKISGVKASSLAEENRGVMQGVVRVRKVGDLIDVYPSPKREKDIGSVSVSSRTLAESKLFGKKSLLRDIESFESLFPEELVREQVRLKIAEYRGPSTPEVPSLFKGGSSSVAALSLRESPSSRSVGSYRTIFKSPSSSMSSFDSASRAYNSASAGASASISRLYSKSRSSSVSGSGSVSASFYGSQSPVRSSSRSRGGSPGSPVRSMSPGSPSPSISITGSPSGSPSRSSIPRSPSSYYPPSKSPPSKRPPYIPMYNDSNKGIRQQLYDVVVRDSGGDLKANRTPLPRSRAEDLGSDIVDNSAAASFAIIPHGSGFAKKSYSNAGPEGYFGGVRHEFRSPKPSTKLPGMYEYVEKNAFRIDTIGELQGITAKGLIARNRMYSIPTMKM